MAELQQVPGAVPGVVPAGFLDPQAGRRIHFVGVGGYGMSAVAHVLAELGCRVTGSDVHASERTRRLADRGVAITLGHSPANVEGADLVIYSTDVPDGNPELNAARKAQVPIWHRSEMLSHLMDSRFSIAVTGTHGKTTTTAMIAFLLARLGLDPTVLVGADFDPIGGTARLGRSEYLVAEADESDQSFLRYHPSVAVITNVEPEHLEYYDGDFSRVVEAYRQFIRNVRPGGLVVLCTDNSSLRELAASARVRVIGYGLEERRGLRAEDLRPDRQGTWFQATWNTRVLGQARLEIPGRHNVLNALAALAVGMDRGLDFAVLAQTLRGFRGPRRRFEICGVGAGITVVDDYAHHPTEIRETLAAARQRASGRVLAVFQPQRYVRTRNLMGDFARAFSGADHLVLAPIYSPPGENPIPGINSRFLARLVEEYEGRSVVYLEDHDDMVEHLLSVSAPGDLIITMGAGDIWKVAHATVERLARPTKTGAPPRPRSPRRPTLISPPNMC
ncbi:MAG: UDP-N-acetylmuramate--L-alanine ligase [bacterium]|nr:UDP-N-acetylmuramate--L-alanine ligase [bacterium]